MPSTPTTFWQWFASLHSDAQITMTIVGLLVSLSVISAVATTIYKMHKNRLVCELKRELLDRGMTADEVATVIGAKPGKAQSLHEHNV